MKNKFGLLAIVGCFLFSVILGQSQNKKICLNGTVRDSSGALVKGAKIFIDNVETFHATNGKGYFKIRTNPKSIKISAYSPNYGKGESRIENDTIINLVLVSYEGMKTDTLFNKNALKDVMSADYNQQTNRYKYSKYLNIYDL